MDYTVREWIGLAVMFSGIVFSLVYCGVLLPIIRKKREAKFISLGGKVE